MDDLNRLIIEKFKAINKDVGQFVAGILSGDLSQKEQIDFAIRLVDLAIAIKEHAQGIAGMVIEGRDWTGCSVRLGLGARGVSTPAGGRLAAFRRSAQTNPAALAPSGLSCPRTDRL